MHDRVREDTVWESRRIRRMPIKKPPKIFQKEGEVNIIKFKREATKRKKESTSVESIGDSNKKMRS